MEPWVRIHGTNSPFKHFLVDWLIFQADRCQKALTALGTMVPCFRLAFPGQGLVLAEVCS